MLVTHFIEKYSAKTGKRIETVPRKVMDAFTAYPWPGNVRELENIVERVLIVTPGNRLEIGPWLENNRPHHQDPALIPLAENERRHILKALEETGWRVSGEKGAAKILEIHPQTLVSRMKEEDRVTNRSWIWKRKKHRKTLSQNKPRISNLIAAGS